MRAWQKQAQKENPHAKHQHEADEAHQAIVSKEQIVQQFHYFLQRWISIHMIVWLIYGDLI